MENNIFEIFNNIKCPVFVIFLFVFILFLYLNNYYAVYSHIPNNNNNNNNNIAIQEIIDQQDKIKVQFAYDHKKININTLTDLKFSVLNSTTNEHIKNFLARVVVTEGPEVFGFDNITVSDGDFSVKHSFTNYGSHQILLRADTNSSIIPASFAVFIPLYQLNPDFTSYLIIGVGIPVSVVMTIILLLILKKK